MKHPAGDLTAAAFGVSRETEAQLQDFLTLLQRWNEHINLVAEREAATIWHRHVLDSLQLLPLLPATPGPLVDLGSGAGFPGLMLALATQRETHLVESDRRKAAFLTEAARLLALRQLRIHPTRVEAATLPPAAIVTARAFASLPILLRHAHRLLRPDGIALFPKGNSAEQELTAAAQDWTMQVERFQSRTDSTATILRLSEIRPVGADA